ncbi:hypothetical protein LIER_22170 [Lithospermum erythrorhizon]|uniref:Uncharacterized protein n=1 Tax=Lithospermum erythrorhizon TaxID=34254 RepID=A0AAV3QWB9_LITER
MRRELFNRIKDAVEAHEQYFVQRRNAAGKLEEYLRRPNDNDITRLLAKAEQRGVPGMLGSIDCMHWEWKNCPT